MGGTRLSTMSDNENLEQDQGRERMEDRNRLSAQQRGVPPRSLNLETASTTYGTCSNIQLDPIEEKYSAENSAAYGSFTRGELQQLILTSQEQIKVDLRLVDDGIDACMMKLMKKLD